MKRKVKGQLPSGNVRIQVYDYTDGTGKRHYQSFTAPTRSEAKAMAAEWQAHRRSVKTDITVRDAVERYIDGREATLSPSTIKTYRGILKTHLQGNFGSLGLRTVSQMDVQAFINSVVPGHSPKTVRNINALLTATFSVYLPDVRMRISLPARIKPDLYTPSDEDVRAVLSVIDDQRLRRAVLLAAFGPLRRGEIAALTSDDIDGCTVTVRRSMVTSDEGYKIKQPKTYSSYRKVVFSPDIIDQIKVPSGRIVNLPPQKITRDFAKAVVKAGVHPFRFHDLRHYSASVMHAIGIPDKYIQYRGGWVSDNVLRSVYESVIDLETERQTRTINEHFSSVIRG